MDLPIAQQIIQALLYFGESTKKVDLAKFLSTDLKNIEKEIAEVKNLLSVLSLELVDNGKSLDITLSPQINSLISKNKIDELKTELSDSALQTLSVILYKAQATKAEIDFVRGVDSARSIKSLLTRGIIERLEEKNRKVYIPSTETLRFLNITETKNIKDYEDISLKLEKLITGE